MSDQLVSVASFHDLTQAQAARSALASEGIDSVLQDEATGSIDWALMPALGGLRLQVGAGDVAVARRILEDTDLLGASAPSPMPAAGQDEDPISEPEEIEYREASRRRKRTLGLVAFLILFLPLLIALIFGFFTSQ